MLLLHRRKDPRAIITESPHPRNPFLVSEMKFFFKIRLSDDTTSAGGRAAPWELTVFPVLIVSHPHCCNIVNRKGDKIFVRTCAESVGLNAYPGRGTPLRPVGGGRCCAPVAAGFVPLVQSRKLEKSHYIELVT